MAQLVFIDPTQREPGRIAVAQATSQRIRNPRKEVHVGNSTLSVSAYDRVASLLLSLLVLVGAAVLCLFVGWLSSNIFHYQKAVPVVIEELASGGGYENGVGTEGQHIEAPTESDIAAESDIMEEAPTDTLSAVVDAAASSDGTIDRFDMQFARGERTGGRSEGTGNHPAKGIGGGFGGGVARRTDWEVRFPPGNTVETYAKQLDFFGIELGVFGSANDVTYISKLSQPKPATRTGPRRRRTAQVHDLEPRRSGPGRQGAAAAGGHPEYRRTHDLQVSAAVGRDAVDDARAAVQKPPGEGYPPDALRREARGKWLRLLRHRPDVLLNELARLHVGREVRQWQASFKSPFCFLPRSGFAKVPESWPTRGRPWAWIKASGMAQTRPVDGNGRFVTRTPSW